MTPTELETLFEKISQFDKHLGVEYKINGAGDVDFHLEIKDHHLSSPKTCHGGVLAAMMDTVLGLTVLSYSVTEDKLCSTVEFKINMLREVKMLLIKNLSLKDLERLTSTLLVKSS